MLQYEKSEDGTLVFQVKQSVYPLKAIYRAAYLFMDRYYIGIDYRNDSYEIRFSGKEHTADEGDIGDFQNELLHQCLKLAMDQDTREIRELIVTRALYSAFIPEEPASFEETEEENDYDLNEIAKAWYEE